jgi:hypothetical protein
VVECYFIVDCGGIPRSRKRCKGSYHPSNVAGWSCLFCWYCRKLISTNVFQARVSAIAIKLQVSLVPLPGHIISALLLLSMGFQSSCTLIIAPRNYSLGSMECWMKTRGILRNTENHSSGNSLANCLLIVVPTWLIFPKNQRKRTSH